MKTLALPQVLPRRKTPLGLKHPSRMKVMTTLATSSILRLMLSNCFRCAVLGQSYTLFCYP